MYPLCHLLALLTAVALFRAAVAEWVSCNFDRGLCGWYQDQNDGLDWTLDGRQGLDHTSGTGRQFGPTAHIACGTLSRLLTYPQPASSATLCLSFWYLLRGAQTGTLSLKMKLLGDAVETLLWTETRSNGDEWQRGISTIDPWGQEFQLIFEVTRDGFEGDAAVDDVTLVSRPCPAQLSCSFEVDTCGYSTDGGARWVRQSHRSGAIPHGPTTDHSLEETTGFYAMADTSLNVLQGGQATALYSEVRSPSAGMECLSFWYLAGGHSPGKPGTGDLGRWVAFEAVGAGGSQTYIAIDDITIRAGHCPTSDFCDFEKDACRWSNTWRPEWEQLDWERTSGNNAHHWGPLEDHSLGTQQGGVSAWAPRGFSALPDTPKPLSSSFRWLHIVLEATRALGAIAVDDIAYEDGRDCQHKPVAASKGQLTPPYIEPSIECLSLLAPGPEKL
uniref:MAM domain-containing protein n=1 Tax=Erpetoichthys calabaricus TaxID=27687 RepID=A0A8C4SVS3_ERPCA